MQPGPETEKGLSAVIRDLVRDLKGYVDQAADFFQHRREVRWQRVVGALPVATPQRFEGREDDVARLDQLFETRNVVWVVGPPGVGKTALAGQFLRGRGLADRARSFELERGSTLQDLLEAFGAFLAEQNQPAFASSLQDPGLSAEARIAALLRSLAAGAWVIVLESYEEVARRADIEQLLQQARDHLSGSKLIVTTQVAPSWVTEDCVVPLRDIDQAAAQRLLALLGVTAGSEEVYRAVGGNPKAIEIAAPVCRTYGVKAALRLGPRRDEQFIGLYREVWQRLPPHARQMWSAAAMLPGTVKSDACIAMCANPDASDAWQQLVASSVLTPRGDRWEMHRLARSAGQRWGGRSRRSRAQCARHIARFYAGSAETIAADRTALEAELENLLAAAHLASESREWEALYALGYRLDDPLDYAGRWTTREDLLRLCHGGALAAGDRRQEAAFAHNLAILLQSRGQLEQAERLYGQSLEIEREVGDRPGEAMTLRNLGAIAQARGRLDEAERLYGQSLEIEREVGNRPGEASTLHQLGIVAQHRGRLDEAERLYGQSLEIAREAGDRPGEAKILHQLGMAAHDRGRLDEAERRYGQSLKIEREVGDRPGEAKILHQLGMVAQDRGQLDEAQRLYEQSLGIEREVGDRPGEARTLHNLGAIAQARGRLDEAEHLYGQSLDIKREVGGRPGEARTLHQLGTVAQHRGRLNEAERRYGQSLKIKREVGDRPGEALTLAQMALLAEEQGNLPLAVEQIEQALAMFEEMGLAEKEQAKQDLERLRKRLAEEGTG